MDFNSHDRKQQMKRLISYHPPPQIRRARHLECLLPQPKFLCFQENILKSSLKSSCFPKPATTFSEKMTTAVPQFLCCLGSSLPKLPCFVLVVREVVLRVFEKLNFRHFAQQGISVHSPLSSLLLTSFYGIR